LVQVGSLLTIPKYLRSRNLKRQESNTSAGSSFFDSKGALQLKEKNKQYIDKRKRYIKKHLPEKLKTKTSGEEIKKKLKVAYVIHAIIKLVFEVFFFCVQYMVFPLTINPLFQCAESPCPNLTDCFVSRPNEKTLIVRFFFMSSILSIILASADLVALSIRKLAKLKSDKDQKFIPELHSRESMMKMKEVQDKKRNSRKVVRNITVDEGKWDFPGFDLRRFSEASPALNHMGKSDAHYFDKDEDLVPYNLDTQEQEREQEREEENLIAEAMGIDD